MSEQREIPEYAKPALYVGILILSVVAAIITFTSDFGWWYNGSSYPDFAIYGVYVEWYGIFVLVILGLGFLYVAFIALQQLYPILKVSEDMNKKLELSGFLTSITLVCFTLIVMGIFIASVSEAYDWDLGTSFYTDLFGALLSTLFFWLIRRINKPSK